MMIFVPPSSKVNAGGGCVFSFVGVEKSTIRVLLNRSRVSLWCRLAVHYCQLLSLNASSIQSANLKVRLSSAWDTILYWLNKIRKDDWHRNRVSNGGDEFMIQRSWLKNNGPNHLTYKNTQNQKVLRNMNTLSNNRTLQNTHFTRGMIYHDCEGDGS